MGKRIAVIGATGALGKLVVESLLALEAEVVALVRDATDEEKRADLRQQGGDVREVDFDSHDSLVEALDDIDVVMSTVSGLRPVIVDLQLALFRAARDAGVAKFMPSDYAIDFRKVPPGDNRNLNLRLDFLNALEAEQQGTLAVTSILNGAFLDMLDGTAPYLIHPIRRSLCWGDCDQPLDFTTMGNTAAYAAHAALDQSSPRWLMIAGQVATPRELAEIASRASGRTYKLMRPGSLGLFRKLIGLTKTLTPKSDAHYPAWQGMQYMENMMRGDVKFPSLDNDRYSIEWVDAERFLKAEVFKNAVPADQVRTPDEPVLS